MDAKSFLLFLALIIVCFIVPFLCRQNKEKSIRENTRYTVGVITKKTGSLKNGNHWHYRFLYNGKKIENYKSTHVDFDVNIGDYFIVELSSRKPEFNNILYGKRLINGKDYYGQAWDTIPKSLLR